MGIELIAVLILILPLFASLVIAPFAFMPERTDAFPRLLSITAVAASSVLSVFLLVELLALPASEQNLSVDFFQLFQVGVTTVHAGFLIDPLSASMLLIVQSVSCIVILYSFDYMRREESKARYFAMLVFFTAMMNLLVLAGNPILLFFGWEGMGAISYLFVIYNRRDSSIFPRALRVFLINRAADVFYLIAVFASIKLAVNVGVQRYSFDHLNLAAAEFASVSIFGMNGAEFVALMFFLGSAAKSAQFPLHVWLSDAMTAPTPVSALIHAATMVTAGIYLMLRIPGFLMAAPGVSELMVVTGVITAFLAGFQALFQNQIKRVLAYSTVSQLGYMIAAAGAGDYTASYSHLITHAYAKSLLFLGVGAVMMRLHHEQDIRKMGGLYRHMKFEAILFLAGALSISGFFPSAGFFSKTGVLHSVGASLHSDTPGLRLLFTFGSLLTPLYLFRAFFMIFGGRESGPLHPTSQFDTRYARLSMTLTLILTLSSGLIFLVIENPPFIDLILASASGAAHSGLTIDISDVAYSFAFGLAGISLAYFLPSVYSKLSRFRFARYSFDNILFFIERNYFLDDVYSTLSKGFVSLAELARRFEALIDSAVHLASESFRGIASFAISIERLIDRFVHFPASAIFRAGLIFQRIQTGHVQHYLYYAITGAILISIAMIYS